MLYCQTTKRLIFSAGLLLSALCASGQNRLARLHPAEAPGAALRPGPPAPPSVAVSRPLGYLADNVVNTTTAWAELPAGATRIRTPNNTDDDYSGAQPIGFNFRFRGKDFANFVLNTNGFIVLGNDPASAPGLFLEGPQSFVGGALYSTEPLDSNLIAVFNDDLMDSDSAPAVYHVRTTGAVGARVCTIEWKNVKDKATPQLSRAEFQIRLFEGSNFIEFVYGNFVASTAAALFHSAAVGLRGKGADIAFGSKFSGSGWDRTIFLTDPDGVNQHNYRNSFLPDIGRTYRFTTTLQNNVGVAGIVGLPTPACNQGVVDSVGVIVANTGSAGQAQIPVTLITDRNPTQTRTLAALDSGRRDTVYFYNLDFSLPGSYGIQAYVSAAGDQLRGNDTLVVDSVQNIIPKAADGVVNTFEDENSLVGWVQYNQNGDGFSWKAGIPDARFANSGTHYLILPNNGTDGSDDWLISGCFGLVGRHKYKLRFHIVDQNPVATSNDAISLQVYALRANVPDTTGGVLLYGNDAFSRSIQQGLGYADTTVSFFAPDTGAFYIGWYVYSNPNISILLLDDVSLDTASGLQPVGTQAPIQTGLRLVPNPAGAAGFAVQGLTAATYEATLTDALGRRRPLTLRKQDDYHVAGSLPAGIYTVQVAGRTLRLAVE